MPRRIVESSLLLGLAVSVCAVLPTRADDSAISSPPKPPGETEVVPGALQGERAQLLQKILKAKRQGCGIGGYMAAFKQLQDDAAGGQTEPQLRSRLTSLSHALDEQLERSKVLKTQHVPPPIAASQPTAPMGNVPQAGGGSGGIDQLMKQYGGQLPPGISKEALMKRIGQSQGNKGSSTDDLMKQFAGSGKAEELLKDPKARAILEKLKAN